MRDKAGCKFAAIIGTPVPAVIGTDYHALKRMTEKKVDLPILTVDTDGMELYDKGEEKAIWNCFWYLQVKKKTDFGQNRDSWHDTAGYQ